MASSDRHCVFYGFKSCTGVLDSMYWSLGLVSWSGVIELFLGVEPWMETLEWNRKLNTIVLVLTVPSQNVSKNAQTVQIKDK